MKKRIIAILVLIVVSVSGFFAYKYFEKENLDVLKFSGELEMDKVDISFRVSGQIDNLLVDEGIKVVANEEVATLDNKEFVTRLNLAEADNTSSVWVLQELEAGFTKEEIAQARQQLAQAKAESQNLEKEFARTQKLYDQKAVSQSEYDRLLTSKNVASLKVSELTERLKQMEIGTRQERIEQAKAQNMASKSNVDLANQQLSYTKLYSPIDGVVLDKYAEVGEIVQAGSPIFSIGNNNKLWLRAYLPVTQAHMIKLGDKMAVTVDSMPDEKFEGVVSFISDVAEFTPKQIQTSIERVKLVYRVKIDIVDTKGLLKPGIPADAVLWE